LARDSSKKYCNYRFVVITANDRGAGTDANVYVTVDGKEGRLDRAVLDNSKNNFETVQIDVFYMELVDLGEITSCTVETDGTGLGSTWKLDKLFIVNETTSTRWVFLVICGLILLLEIKKLKRVFKPTTGKTSYQVKVHTGRKSGAGTDASVFVIIKGTKGITSKMELETSQHANKFEDYQVDRFALDSKEVGQITHMTIGHDNSGFGASWYLEDVEIEDLATGDQYFFTVEQWFDKKSGDGLIERTLKPTKIVLASERKRDDEEEKKDVKKEEKKEEKKDVKKEEKKDVKKEEKKKRIFRKKR